jgi:hypothetical protein
MKNIKITPNVFQSIKKDMAEGLTKRQICSKYDIRFTSYYSVLKCDTYEDLCNYRNVMCKAVINSKHKYKGSVRSSRKMDEKTFDKVKTLLSLGATPGQVSKIIEFSRPTVKRIRTAKNWEQYLADNEAMKERARAKRLAFLNESGSTVISYDEPEKESEKIETPILDVLIEIRDELRTLTEQMKALGKSKFRLF